MTVKLAASGLQAPAFLRSAVLAGALLAPTGARAEWRLEAFTGTAHNFTTPLTLRQEGRPEFRMDARYDTRPFTGSPYDARAASSRRSRLSLLSGCVPGAARLR